MNRSLAIFLISVFASVSVHASVSPNFFRCDNFEKELAMILLSPASAGVPQVDVLEQGLTIVFIDSKEIEIKSIPNGQTVSVVDTNAGMPSVRYTLVLPTVSLKDSTEVVHFDSTIARQPIGKPKEVVKVSCFAEYAVFH